MILEGIVKSPPWAGCVSVWGRVFEFASFADLILEVSILSLSKDAVYKAKEDSFDDPSPFDKLRPRRELCRTDANFEDQVCKACKFKNSPPN